MVVPESTSPNGLAPGFANRILLVAVDGSDLSLEALRRTVVIASGIGSEIVVLFVRHLQPPIADPATGVAAVVALESSVDELESIARSSAERLLDQSGVPWRFEVREGEPAHEIVAAAHEVSAACVVVGSTLHGAIAGFLLGSVASHLLRHCDISVLVVRPDPQKAKSTTK